MLWKCEPTIRQSVALSNSMTQMGIHTPLSMSASVKNMLDLQEMAVWSALNWRLADFRQLARKYDPLARELHLMEPRTLENCLHRLEVRGLVASRSGGERLEALYDLLGELYVVPISESLLLVRPPL